MSSGHQLYSCRALSTIRQNLSPGPCLLPAGAAGNMSGVQRSPQVRGKEGEGPGEVGTEAARVSLSSFLCHSVFPRLLCALLLKTTGTQELPEHQEMAQDTAAECWPLLAPGPWAQLKVTAVATGTEQEQSWGSNNACGVCSGKRECTPFSCSGNMSLCCCRGDPGGKGRVAGEGQGTLSFRKGPKPNCWALLGLLT